jgi:hypothetical protein
VLVRLSILLGNAMEVAGLIVALILLWLAPTLRNPLLAFLLYVIALVFLVFFPHCLAHYAVGRLMAIQFDYYRSGKSGIAKLKLPVVSSLGSKLPVLTLKVDRSSLHSADRLRAAAMFSAGAVASMVFPFIAAASSIGHLPLILSITLALIAAANLLFDLYYSPKAGDLARARAFYRSS